MSVPNAVNPRRWALWRQRRRLIGYALLIETAAVVATVVSAHAAPRSSDWRLVGGLVVLGVVQAELARQIERTRRMLAATPHVNMSSVWTFAGVLLLPVQLIALLVVALYAHLAARSWRGIRRVPPFRTAFNASLVVVTCLISRGVLAASGWSGVAAATHDGFRGFLPVFTAAAAYFVVAALIAIPGLSISTWNVESVLGSWSDNGLELATLGLGAINAVLLVVMPELSVAVVPITLLVARSVLARDLEVAATTDAKTGVYNAQAWRRVAVAELARADQAKAQVGLLLIDVDRFKLVNDTHGHLAGDKVLRHIATAIDDVVRSTDSLGRFGGEEFVVLLPNASHPLVLAVAERVRRAVAELRVHLDEQTTLTDVSVSVGVAVYPRSGEGLDTLLQSADRALYAAKEGGRNRIELAAS
ncbi:GGDEF domain-containing protein [uncultured Jatrophihabitans sp.]|uniref:GGDEF domain-containing protein n=1 Tax=uncultured Jatrophihabitans sp. TaxID=1610747 RepID=UPI0035C98F2A